MNHLGLLDYIVIASYFALVLGVGFFFLKRQKSTRDYFIANRRIPGWAMGIALIATLISNITFLANPAASFAGDLRQFTNSLMAIAIMFPVALILIPFYRNSIGMSLYEFFEKRFGYAIRFYGAITFILYYLSRLGVILFSLAVAINVMTGWNIYHILIGLGIITILYTLTGGIEAVTWIDVFQGILFIAVGFMLLAIALFGANYGTVEILNAAWEKGKFSLGESGFSLQRDTVLVMLLYGFAQHSHNFGTDQTMVQRYLTAKSTRQAVRSALISGIACVPVWGLFFFVGIALWAYYTYSGVNLPIEVLEKPDRILPYFVMQQLPAGIIGLVIAALLSAAMSTISGGLNSTSTVFTNDIVKKVFPLSSDKNLLGTGRFTVFVAGSLSLLIAMWLVNRTGQVLEIYFTALSIFSGGILGLVILAFTVKKASTRGVGLGILATLMMVAWASLTGKKVVDLGVFNYTLHPYLIGFFSHLTMFIAGFTGSLIFPDLKAAEKYINPFKLKNIEINESG
jgi:solute:Na+ symporter, SSS family